MKKDQEQNENGAGGLSMAGTAMSVAAGLCFFFLCMLLPIVGPAGSREAHADKNQLAFIGVLLVTFMLAALASWLKLKRSKEDGSPKPFWMLGLCGLCVLTFIVLLTGGFSI